MAFAVTADVQHKPMIYTQHVIFIRQCINAALKLRLQKKIKPHTDKV